MIARTLVLVLWFVPVGAFAQAPSAAEQPVVGAATDGREARLAERRATSAVEGSVAPGADERAAAMARRAEITQGLLAIKARARQISLLAPSLLIGLGAVGVGSALLSGLLLSLGVADAREHGESANRTPMRVAFGMIPVGAALLVSGGVWFALRRKRRHAIVETGKPLELERREIDMKLAPRVGPSSLGLSLNGRF